MKLRKKLETENVYAIFDRLPPKAASHLFFYDFAKVTRNIEKLAGHKPIWVSAHRKIHTALHQAAKRENAELFDEVLGTTEDTISKFISAINAIKNN